MPEGEVKLRVTTEGAEQANTALGKIKETMSGLGGATSGITGAAGALGGLGFGAIAANQAMELLGKGVEVLKKPFEEMNHLAEEAMSLFKELRLLSSTMGSTIQEAEDMKNTFALAGISVDRLGFAMFTLANHMDRGGEALIHMGVELKDAHGVSLTAIEGFEAVRDKISKMANATDQARAATEAFGAYQARSNMPILQMTAEQYDKYKKKGEETAVMTEELAEKSRQLIETSAELDQKFEKLKMHLTAMIAIPVVQWMKEIGLEVVNMAQTFVERMEVMYRIGKEAADANGGGFFLTWLGAALIDPALRNAVAAAEKLANELKKQDDKIKENLAKRAEAAEEAGKKLNDLQIKELIERGRADDEINTIRLQGQQRINAAMSKLRTDSDTEAIQSQVEMNNKLIAMAEARYERERAAKIKGLHGGRLTDKEELELKSVLEKEKARLTQQNANLQVDIERARVNDIKKLAAEEANVREFEHKRWSGNLKAAYESEQGAVKMFADNQAQMTATLYKSEIEGAKSARDETTRFLNEKESALHREAAAIGNNAAEQKRIAQELRAVGQARVDNELQADKAIQTSRENLLAKIKEMANQQAAIGQSLEQKAIASLAARGKTNITQEDVAQERARLGEKNRQTAGNYAMGGRVKGSDLLESRDYGNQLEQMRQIGTNPAAAVSMFQGQQNAAYAGRAFRGIPTGMESMAPEIQALATQMKKSSDDAVERLGTTMQDLFTYFTDRLIRKMQFESARQ